MNPASRIDIFKQMLVTDPGNTMVMFGLAKEYEKAGRDEELIETLNRYLETADDEETPSACWPARMKERAKEIKRAMRISAGSKPRNATDIPEWQKSIA